MRNIGLITGLVTGTIVVSLLAFGVRAGQKAAADPTANPAISQMVNAADKTDREGDEVCWVNPQHHFPKPSAGQVRKEVKFEYKGASGVWRKDYLAICPDCPVDANTAVNNWVVIQTIRGKRDGESLETLRGIAVARPIINE